MHEHLTHSLFSGAAQKLQESFILSEIVPARASGRRKNDKGITENQSREGEEGKRTVEERTEVRRVKEK